MKYKIIIKPNRELATELNREEYTKLKNSLLENAAKFIKIGNEIINTSAIISISGIAEKEYISSQLPEPKKDFEKIGRRLEEMRRTLIKKGIIGKSNL